MTDTRIATCEEVIAELWIFYAHETGRSLTECVTLISPEMSIEKLLRLDSDLDWKGFFQHFGIQCPESFVGTPLNAQCTVRDFAQYLAGQIEVPIPRPVTILGKPCLSAGLFMEIKDQLVQKGERENDISPSSNIEPFLVRHHDLFRKVRWYAPGKLPALNVRNRITELGCLEFFLIPIATAIYNGLTSKFAPEMPSAWIYSLGLFIGSLICIAVGTIFRNQLAHASFEGLTDFRSLVNVLLDRPQIRNRKQRVTWNMQ
jgi:hypothetical protein